MAAGFAQFGVTAALADVAAEFGEPQPEIGVVAQAGLTGTTLGIGLAIIRLASLGALPLAGLADRLGRRVVLLAAVSAGLGFTVIAGLSPTFWWFVVIFAIGVPMLSATNGVALVVAAEETASRDRYKAIALVGAAYALGAGLLAITRGIAGEALTFRGLFALALIPLLLVPLLGRKLEEPERFELYQRDKPVTRPSLGAVHSYLWGRLLLLGFITAAVSLVTGPANMFLFYFGESVVGISPGRMAMAVFAAGPTGLAGLVIGRWAADTLGRRVCAGSAVAVVAGAGVITYSGSATGVIGGYLLGIFAGAAFTPAGGALSTELFPTSVRGVVAGWLTASGVIGAVAGLFLFGILVDVFGDFGRAALIIMGPVALVGLLYARLPETRGLELESSAPEPA
jgi:MFS family permease